MVRALAKIYFVFFPQNSLNNKKYICLKTLKLVCSTIKNIIHIFKNVVYQIQNEIFKFQKNNRMKRR